MYLFTLFSHVTVASLSQYEGYGFGMRYKGNEYTQQFQEACRRGVDKVLQ